MKRYAIIVAGGRGTRMGSELPKQFLRLAGKPILAHTLDNFYRFDPATELVVVLPASQQEYWKAVCQECHIDIPHRIASGGETRFHSVRNGLALLPDDGLVAIHDGVRPLVAHTVIERCFAAAQQYGGAIPALPLTDSLRQLGPDGSSLAVARSRFVAARRRAFASASRACAAAIPALMRKRTMYILSRRPLRALRTITTARQFSVI